MSTQPTRIFVARLLGLDVFDPLGDRLGKLRDVVVLGRGQPHTAPHAVGIVVEVPGKKRVFVPMTRLTSMDQSQIICTGLVNLRRFEQRGAEQLVVGGIFERYLFISTGSVYDVARAPDDGLAEDAPRLSPVRLPSLVLLPSCGLVPWRRG